MPTLLKAASTLRREPARDLALAALLGALSVGAWLALWAWSASPWARYAAHDGWLDSEAFAALCRSVPAGSIVCFSSTVIHRSGANLTDRYRRVYLLQYSAEVIMDKDGQRPWGSFEQFLADGEIVADAAAPA